MLVKPCSTRNPFARRNTAPLHHRKEEAWWRSASSGRDFNVRCAVEAWNPFSPLVFFFLSFFFRVDDERKPHHLTLLCRDALRCDLETTENKDSESHLGCDTVRLKGSLSQQEFIELELALGGEDDTEYSICNWDKSIVPDSTDYTLKQLYAYWATKQPHPKGPFDCIFWSFWPCWTCVLQM